MVYGYIRINTNWKRNDGNSLNGQKHKLNEAGATIIYEDVITGPKAPRHELNKLKSVLVSGDTVTVTKLDILARSALKGVELIDEWTKKGIKVHILNMGLIDESETGKLIKKILYAFVEFEQDIATERAQDGKANAKASNPNFKEGRPQKFDEKQLEKALEMLETESYSTVSKLTGISVSTLTRAKRKKGTDMAMKAAGLAGAAVLGVIVAPGAAVATVAGAAAKEVASELNGVLKNK